jgi:Kef-type K+ transport system membrane component KefB
LDLLLILAVALAAGRVATRAGYPAVLGELVAGILLGPPVLGWLNSSDSLHVVAEIGVMLMMVYIGMEIDLGDLRRASTPGALAALGGFIVPFGLGYYATVGFGYSSTAGMFIGMAVGVTSLATKSRILADLGILDTRIAHVMIAGALISDTLSLVVFAGVISVATEGAFNLVALGLVLLRIAGFVVGAWLLGMFVVPRVFAGVAKRTGTGRTLHLALTMLVVLGFAQLAEAAGLHSILGAFLAGLFLREGIRVRRMSYEITEVVKDVSLGFLAPVFFVSAGFGVSFSVFTEETAFLVTVIVLATAGKIIGTTLFYLPSGRGWREGLTVGAGMNGRGAVEIIIAGIGLQLGIIGQEIFSVLVFMAIFTTATVPVLLKLGVDRLRRRGELTRSDTGTKPILIVGAGALARRLAVELLGSRSVSMIDLNPQHVYAARRLGLSVLQADGLDTEVLQRAGVEDCGTVIAMTPNPAVNVLVAQRARETFLISDVRAMMQPNSDAGLFDLLDGLGAAPLFGAPIEFWRWEAQAEARGDQSLTETTTSDMLATSDGRDRLALLVDQGEGLRVFDGLGGLQADDHLRVLEAGS